MNSKIFKIETAETDDWKDVVRAVNYGWSNLGSEIAYIRCGLGLESLYENNPDLALAKFTSAGVTREGEELVIDISMLTSCSEPFHPTLCMDELYRISDFPEIVSDEVSEEVNEQHIAHAMHESGVVVITKKDMEPDKNGDAKVIVISSHADPMAGSQIKILATKSGYAVTIISALASEIYCAGLPYMEKYPQNVDEDGFIFSDFQRCFYRIFNRGLATDKNRRIFGPLDFSRTAVKSVNKSRER